MDEERTGEFKERRIGLADLYGTTAQVELGDDGDINLRVYSGMCGARAYPTPEAARQLAAALIDAAEAAAR